MDDAGLDLRVWIEVGWIFIELLPAPEVNPAKDAGRAIFSRCFREASELAGDARVHRSSSSPTSGPVGGSRLEKVALLR